MLFDFVVLDSGTLTVRQDLVGVVMRWSGVHFSAFSLSLCLPPSLASTASPPASLPCLLVNSFAQAGSSFSFSLLYSFSSLSLENNHLSLPKACLLPGSLKCLPSPFPSYTYFSMYGILYICTYNEIIYVHLSVLDDLILVTFFFLFGCLL